MSRWTRRDVFRSGMAAAGAAMVPEATPQQVRGAAERIDRPAVPPLRERLLLDCGWRFHFGHAADPARDFGFGARPGTFSRAGSFLPAGSLSFNDADWKPVDLPHDWAVELPLTNDPALASRGFYPLGRAYPETSVGWYRRVFELPASDAGRRISLEFDGAFRQSMVVFNNFWIGDNSSGYAPFRFDVTDFANFGGRNVVLVRVDATMGEGSSYEGAGIYRHVWLVKTAPVHVRQWGTFARTRVWPGGATVLLRTEVENHGGAPRAVRLISTVFDPAGRAVARSGSLPATIPESGEHVYEQQVAVSKPALWSLEQPNLYRIVTELFAGGEAVDRYETTFGIRSCHFDPDRGFLLNGRPVKIQGTCNHQDHAGVGSALPDAVHAFRVRKLQEMGSNAWRTAHHHPAPELLDACDRMGMLVFDEPRLASSNPEGLSQLERLVRRDRNHPSVFLWSLGNDESEAATDRGRRILSEMKQVTRGHDGTRPVFVALPPAAVLGKGAAALADVIGCNFDDPGAEALHKAHPEIPVLGSENVRAVATRGVYAVDGENGFVSSYDVYTATGRGSAEGWWRFATARPWLAGGFVWTGFDYRGEPSPFGWPNIGSQYGALDTCGFPKDTFYYYQSCWSAKPVLHLLPHWNWPGREGQEVAVWVYSNLERVELFLNGESLGAQDARKDSHLAWRVKFAPGLLEARGFKGGQQVATARRETAGPAARLAVKPDRAEIAADGDDLAMIAVEVQDEQGRPVPLADNEISFRVSGPGRLVGLGNGKPTSHEPDKGTSRHAFNGLCMGLVQASREPGTIRVEVSSQGLPAASVTVGSRPVVPRPLVPVWEREIPSGEGITGLWRPVQAASENAPAIPGFPDVYAVTFRQDGGRLSGNVEGVGEVTLPLEDGKVESGKIEFRVGPIGFTGELDGERLRLRANLPRGRPGRSPGGDASAPKPAEPPPAVGPPPDGTDQSRPAGRGARTSAELVFVLARASR